MKTESVGADRDLLAQVREAQAWLKRAVFHVSEPGGGEHWEFEQDAQHSGDLEQRVAQATELLGALVERIERAEEADKAWRVKYNVSLDEFAGLYDRFVKSEAETTRLRAALGIAVSAWRSGEVFHESGVCEGCNTVRAALAGETPK